jgi:hypothetical protein
MCGITSDAHTTLIINHAMTYSNALLLNDTSRISHIVITVDSANINNADIANL